MNPPKIRKAILGTDGNKISRIRPVIPSLPTNVFSWLMHKMVDVGSWSCPGCWVYGSWSCPRSTIKNLLQPIRLQETLCTFLLWCGAESNRRHMDFQSIALPTELPHRSSLFRSGCKCRAWNDFWQVFQGFFGIFFSDHPSIPSLCMEVTMSFNLMLRRTG